MTFPLLADPIFSARVLRVNVVWYRPRISPVDSGYRVEGDMVVIRGKDEIRQRFEAGSLEDLFVKMNVFLEGEKMLAMETAKYGPSRTGQHAKGEEAKPV